MSNTDQHTVFDATPIRTRHFTKLCKLAYPWESVSEIQLIEQLDYRYPLSLFLCFEQELDSCYSKQDVGNRPAISEGSSHLDQAF